jgi:hypothetical protein
VNVKLLPLMGAALFLLFNSPTSAQTPGDPVVSSTVVFSYGYARAFAVTAAGEVYESSFAHDSEVGGWQRTGNVFNGSNLTSPIVSIAAVVNGAPPAASLARVIAITAAGEVYATDFVGNIDLPPWRRVNNIFGVTIPIQQKTWTNAKTRYQK